MSTTNPPSRPVRDLKALTRRRLKAAGMFDQGATQAQVARDLGVSAQTASRWYWTWRAGGRTGLRGAPRLGRPSRLTSAQWRRVERVLLGGAQVAGFDGELWTLARVATVIQETTGVAYHPNYVAELLHRHGWTPQRPARRAAERDGGTIAGWVKTVWPTVTGGGQANQVDRLS